MVPCAIIVILAIGVILRTNSFFGDSVSPFISTPISLAYLGLATGHITPDPFQGSYWAGHANSFSQDRIFTSLLLITLGQIAGVKINLLAYVPIVGLLLPAVGMVIMQRLTKSNLLSIAYGLFLVFTPLVDQFFIEYQPLAYVYHFLLLYFLVRILSEKTSTRSYIAIAVLLLVAAYQTYYTIEMSNALLLFGTFIGMLFFAKYFKKAAIHQATKNGSTILTLGLITLTLFVGIDQIVYENLTGNYATQIGVGLSKLTSELGSTDQLVQSYTPTSSSLLVKFDIALRVVLLLGAVVPLISFLVHKRLSKQEASVLPFFLAMILYSILEPIIYQGFTTDYVVSRNMVLTLPIATFVLLRTITPNQLERLAGKIYPASASGHKEGTISKVAELAPTLVIGAILAIGIADYAIATGSNYQWGATRGFRDVATTGVAEFVQYVKGDYITSTHELSSIIFQQAVAAHKDQTISPDPFKESISNFTQSLVTNNSTGLCSRGLSDIAIPKYTDRPLAGEIWGGSTTHTPPLGDKLYNINNFNCFDKVYDNRLISVYFNNQK